MRLDVGAQRCRWVALVPVSVSVLRISWGVFGGHVPDVYRRHAGSVIRVLYAGSNKVFLSIAYQRRDEFMRYS